MSGDTNIVICPSCSTKNRVDSNKSGQHPTCGNCKTPLPIGGPVTVGDDDFDHVVMGSELLVLVDFWAPWCGPCKMVAPMMEKIAQEYAGRLVVAKVNTDDNREVAGKFNIKGIPTMMLVKGGEVVERLTGAVPKSHLDEMIRKYLQDS